MSATRERGVSAHHNGVLRDVDHGPAWRRETRCHDVSALQHKLDCSLVNLHSREKVRVPVQQPQCRDDGPGARGGARQMSVRKREAWTRVSRVSTMKAINSP